MASRSTTETPIGTEKVQWAKPLHIQRLERALRLDHFLDYVQQVLSNPVSDLDETTETEGEIVSDEANDRKALNGVPASRQERRSSRMCLFNFSKVKKTRRWLKSILLSDSSESEEDHELTCTEEDFQHMLYFHKLRKAAHTEFLLDPEIRQYQYYSVGLLSNLDKYQEQQNLVVGGKKKLKEKKTITKKKATKVKKNKSEKLEKKMDHQGYILPYELQEAAEMASSSKDGKLRQKSPEDGHKEPTSQKSHSKKKSAANHDAVMAMKRRRLWTALAKKEISRAQKQRVNAHKEVLTMTRRLAHVCQRECRKAALLSQKVMKDAPSRARRLTREMLLYWKRYDKIEKEHRKRAEREAQEQMRMDIELREAKRQQRKLNFLITQTELYAHFMSKKVSGVQQDEKQKEILSQLDEDTICSVGRNPNLNIEENDYNSEEAKMKALQTAEEAYKAHQSKTKAFDSEILQVLKNESGDLNKNFRLTNPSLSTDSDLPQPRMFVGKLKTYQLKGMNWLHNLYDKGINGILADEMGLGKTVQTIALLATLAEVEGVWGPFLIIAPASTLHNWQQEFTKFIPKFKVLPYWGNTSDRKILRKFWSQKDLHTERASFHVLITSYQLVVQDVKYFQRVKWQYLVLDEAQAIKSTSSVRWKILLGFNCRNRLLLTGTPIQNSMAELWALLHFIMPTLFDSHEEFNEWFSKDIESHAENKSGIDERHLSRLHMILKPFMLRRIKKDVENELSDKIEILVYCQLTERQKLLYRSLKNKISIEDLMQSSSSTPSQAQSVTSSLLNLVMQFRKVCNHPDLFERREPRSSFRMQLDSYILPKLLFREGLLSLCSEGRYHLLSQKLGVFHPEHVHHSLFPPNFQVNRVTHSDCAFSFTRFIDISPAELSSVALTGLLARWLSMYLTLKAAYRIQHQQTWQAAELSRRRTLQHNGLLLVQTLPTVKPCALPPLVFTDPCSSVYTLTTHLLHCMPETTQHRQIRLQKLIAKHNQTLSVSGSPSLSPPSLKKLPHNFTEVVHRWRPTQRLECQTTELPIFLTQTCSKVVSEPLRVYCCDPSAIWWQKYSEKCGSPRAFRWIMYGDPDATSVLVRQAANQFNPLPPGGLFSIQPMDGWSHILIPDKETLVTDSGKLDVLDDLLMRLKAEGHRVLIYSQMTRMIDLLEEYMWHRKHTYMRLDGSSKISDRRDMVAGFQTRSDIFVFLLSTRAGGLGINLTAADTVIFYDSDWNPTVDQQAMDRAHRLGQTKQVTVYRLVCKGSIEERILQRAREKSEIQRMVISGGNFKPDTLKPKEVVSLLLDDEELEKKFRQRQEERRKEQEEANVDSGQRRKYKGAKRGPKPKRKKLEENITTPAPSDPATPTHQDGDSVLSVDSVPQSPYSELSVNSLAMAHDDTSSEGPLVVDDGSPSVPPPTKVTSISGLLESQTSNPSSDPTLRTPSPAGIKRGSGRGRGRPRGSGRRGGRGRGVSTLAVAAAEMAAAQAGKSAYAVYSYGLSGRGSVRGRGSGVTRGHRGPPRVNHSQKSPSEGQSTEPVKTSTSLGFYVQNSPQ